MIKEDKISIIIPAFNEEKVILRCLNSIYQGTAPELLQVIVVCNGCTDSTYTIVKNKYKEVIQILNIEKPSKSNALNVGDKLAKYFPRFYIDADVYVTGKSLLKV
ncbi:MAG: glycosyltransferase, partial [Candidatus Electrothrix sp. LOE1_4_5]|nr:glycosyltransferase [Candidatus Electrothrix gigas]